MVLKVVKRQEVAQKIKEAREQGDLSENAEYDAANRGFHLHSVSYLAADESPAHRTFI